MTPKRAGELARENGCTITYVELGLYVISRSPDNWAFITAQQIEETTEQQFIAFYIPDRRD